MTKEFTLEMEQNDEGYYDIMMRIPQDEFSWCTKDELEETIQAACAQALLADLIKDMHQRGAEEFLSSFMENTLQFSRSIVLPVESVRL